MIDHRKFANVPVGPVTAPVKAQVGPPKVNGAPQPEPATEQPTEKKARIEPEVMFYSAAKAESKTVVVQMKSGREHVGRVTRFGHYNIEIETDAGPVLLYKAAIESARFGS